MTPDTIDVAALRRLLDDYAAWKERDYGRSLGDLHALEDALVAAVTALLRAVEQRDALLAAAEEVSRMLRHADQEDGMSPWSCNRLAQTLEAAILLAKESQ